MARSQAQASPSSDDRFGLAPAWILRQLADPTPTEAERGACTWE